MSEPVFEAFARIRPVLDPSFRQDAQQQIQSQLEQAQVNVKVTPRQALQGAAQATREISLSKSVAETEALSAAFKRLEIAGVASQERVAAAAVEVRTALGLTSTQGVAAQERLTAAALTTSKAIGSTGVAAQEAAQLQIAAQKRVQAASVAPNLGQQAGLRSQGVQGQVASLAALKQQGFLTQSAIASTSASIAGLESAIGDLQKLRVGAGGSVLTQIDTQLATLVPELAAARAGFQSVVAPIASVEQAAAKAAVATGRFTGPRSALASAASSAGLNSVALRYGLVGVAALTAFTAVSRASQALEVTGERAFTTEGRLRNLGSSLLRGDLIGGIEALISRSKELDFATVIEGLQKVANNDQAIQTLDHYRNTLNEAAQANERNSASLDPLLAKIREQDGVVSRAQAGMLGLAAANATAATSQRDNAEAAAALALAIQQAAGVINGVTTEGVAEAARNRQLTPFERAQKTRTDPLGSPSFRNSLAEQLAAAQGNDAEVLRLQKLDQARLTKQLADTRLNGDKLKDLQARKNAADVAVASTERTQRERAVVLAEATAREAKAAREAAARAAQAAASDARNAREIDLQNNVAKAALTKRKTDDIARTKELIDYLKTVRDNTDLTATERAQAKTKITAARKNLQSVLKGEDPAAGPDDARRLKELQLSNAEARAALTKRKSDDRKAILASITYYRNLTTTLRKAGKDIDAETAESARISAQGRLKALKTTTAATGGASTEDFFKAAVANFRQFGSNISANPNGILSPQDARGAFAAIALADPLVTAVDRGTSEQRKQTLLLGSIAGALGVGAKPPARSAKASTAAADEALRHSIFLHGV